LASQPGTAVTPDVARAEAAEQMRSVLERIARLPRQQQDVVVGALLVAPAFGLGSRLLDLIRGAPVRPEVQTPVWSPDGRKIAFLWARGVDHEGNSLKELYVVNADGSGQRRVTQGGA
jgi:hypothetical protein